MPRDQLVTGVAAKVRTTYPCVVIYKVDVYTSRMDFTHCIYVYKYQRRIYMYINMVRTSSLRVCDDRCSVRSQVDHIPGLCTPSFRLPTSLALQLNFSFFPHSRLPFSIFTNFPIKRPSVFPQFPCSKGTIVRELLCIAATNNVYCFIDATTIKFFAASSNFVP